MSAHRALTRCTDVAPLLVFYVCNEVDAREREQIAAHLATCEDCAKQLKEETVMQDAVVNAWQAADQLDPNGSLLAQCRSELAETLDDLSAPKVKQDWVPFGWVRRWMAMRPAWSAAFLLLFGLTFGVQLAPWFSSGSANQASGDAMNVMAAPRLTDDDLSKMAVAGINLAPASEGAPGTLQVRVRTEQPVTVVGNVDNADMRRVLTYVVANGARFDPDVRLDCLEVLKTRSDDELVKRALVTAARKDPNPAVRMKALEALRDATDEDAVRETMLQALEHDANPGVRVEAVNLLVLSLQGDGMEPPESPNAAPEAPGPEAPEMVAPMTDASMVRVVRVLEQLQRSDPNRYVRLRSAAALRQIDSRDVQ
jgi:anti-sigma factor RsiW